jgi:hexosaminidase
MVEVTDYGFMVPSVTIDDKPRFPWRGMMIDTGRHFIPLDVLRQDIDLMEASKLNVFHWHLSEDQGFRMESKIYPLLQGKESDGLYYTQDQTRELITYARDRGIRVVPELDMPGHAASWFVGYPELASGTGPYSIIRKWGIFDPAMDPTRESTYQFLDRFLGEMTAIFPDAYFHIGGDECNGKEWNANPCIQKFMHEYQLKDDAALQAYFTSRVEKLVTKYHKITVGWDEVLQAVTPRDVVIQSWRGQESLAVAARQGNRGILSWGYYLDLNQPASRIAAGNASAADFAQALQWLTVWHDNDAALQCLLAGSSLTRELAPMSLNLKQTAVIGLDALSSLESHKHVSSSVQEQQLDALKS